MNCVLTKIQNHTKITKACLQCNHVALCCACCVDPQKELCKNIGASLSPAFTLQRFNFFVHVSMCALLGTECSTPWTQSPRQFVPSFFGVLCCGYRLSSIERCTGTLFCTSSICICTIEIRRAPAAVWKDGGLRHGSHCADFPKTRLRDSLRDLKDLRAHWRSKARCIRYCANVRTLSR